MNYILKGMMVLSFMASTIISVKANLEDEIKKIEIKIQKVNAAYQDRDFHYDGRKIESKLKKYSQLFDNLSANAAYNDADWERLAKSKNYVAWHSRSSKEIVGGNLFFPTRIGNFYFEEVQKEVKSILSRRDILTLLAIAAKYNEPRGQYYLATLLESNYTAYDNRGKIYPTLFEELYERAMPALSRAAEQDNIQALYMLAHEHSFGSINGGFKFDRSQAEKYSTRLASLTQTEKFKNDEYVNKIGGYVALNYLRFRKNYPSSPSNKPNEKEELVSMAEKYKSGPALRKLYVRQKEVSLLERAANDYKDIFSEIDLGFYYVRNNNIEKSKEHFRIAQNKGISEAYVEEARLIHTNMVDRKKLETEVKTHERKDLLKSLEPAKKLLEKAMNLGDLEGWHKLAYIYEALCLGYQEPEDQNHLKESVKKGLDLKDRRAYDWLEIFSEEETTRLMKEYGPAPQGDLWQEMKAYIEGNPVKK